MTFQKTTCINIEIINFFMHSQPTNNHSYFMEMKASVELAKAFPRNIEEIKEAIKEACSNEEFAKQCVVKDDKGEYYGSAVLVKFIANEYGNIEFGARQISQNEKEATFSMFCWDIQKNIKKTETCTVFCQPRKASENETDNFQRYDYDNITIGAKLNNCIKAIIPAEIFDNAVKQCVNVCGFESGVIQPRGISKTTASGSYDMMEMPPEINIDKPSDATVEDNEPKQDEMFEGFPFTELPVEQEVAELNL